MTSKLAHQLRGRTGLGRNDNPNKILQFGPRYTRPLDHTMIMSVFHRTTGGDVSILLDDLSVTALARWLVEPTGTHQINDLQTTAFFTRQDSNVIVSVQWNGSRRGQKIVLSLEDVAAVHMWLMDEALTYRWPGWLRPSDVPGSYHDHVKINGRQEPCRLCKIRKEVNA
jgi:hypothetical protein